MTDLEVQAKRSGEWVRPLRSASAVLGVVLLVAFLVPLLGPLARRYEYLQALQFCVFAFLVPALITVGAPWDRMGLASRQTYAIAESGERVSPLRLRWVDRRQLRRSSISGRRYVVLEAFVFGLLTFVWRIAPVADGLVRHPWLVGIEALSLLVAGVALFSDLVESPPLRPRAPRPVRIGIAAVEMWAVWIVAYVYGMSHSSWYVAFHYVAGRGLSQTADQQLSSAVIWLTSAAVFLSVAFWNLAQWLRNEEDLGDELDQLVREERSRGFFGSRDF